MLDEGEILLPIEPGWSVSRLVGCVTGKVYYRLVCGCGEVHLENTMKSDSPKACLNCNKEIPEAAKGFLVMCWSEYGSGGR